MKKITSLMLMLLCAVTTWAGVTDLPEMSTDGNTKWYTIRNTRSTSGKYLYWNGDAANIQDSNTLTDASLFYFTGTTDACYIHNAATSNLFASESSWTAEGTVCTITVTPHSSQAGLAIGFNGTYLNEKNYDAGYTTWYADDEGSIFVIEEFGADIQEALDRIIAYKDQSIIGEYKYDEEKYNSLSSAYETFKANASIASYEACKEILNTIEVNMPEVGKFYLIEAPLFYNTQSVHKALYSDGTNPGWNTLDKTDKSFYWTPVATDNGLAWQNVGDSKYILGQSANNTAWTMVDDATGAEFSIVVVATGETQADYQYAISITGRHMHANNHNNGAAASGNIVSWETNNANSASAWTITETEDPDANVPVSVIYNLTYNDEIKFTQTTASIAGDQYPAITIALPFGVTGTAPTDETISADDATEVDGVKTITKEIALSISLPFTYYNNYDEVTTWYYVKMRDDSPTYLYYDSNIAYIKATETTVPTDAKDAYSWAFIGDPFNGFKIVNILAGSSMILSSPATPTTEQDAEQLVRMVAEEGATGNIYWDFTAPTHTNAAENCFYIQHPDAPAYALNRQSYNGSASVCYWNGRDTGSAFQVVERPTLTGELEALIATAEAKKATMESLIGEAAGYYSQSAIDALAAAITVAQNVTVAEESDIATLQAAIDAVRCNIPAVGSFIAFQSASTNTYCQNKYVKTVPVVTNYSGGGYAADRDHTQLVFDTYEPATTPSAVFQVIAGDNEGEFKLKNMHTQEYVVSFVKNATHMGTEANAVAITIQPLGEGQVAVYGANDEMPMHAQEAHNVIVTWTAELNNASAWNILDVETFAHTLSISSVGYSTLKLGFDATIPEGVECYYINAAIDEQGIVQLTQVDGAILPANTAVVVKLAEGYEAGDYSFTYSATAGTAIEGNQLDGTLYDNNITPDGTAYVLSAPDNKVGLYVATLTEGAFLNNANKAYFDVVTESGDAAASYSFSFDWEGTTGIEGVEAEGTQNGKIYDITGREVKAITAPGIYIVNGKKVVK